MEQLSNEDRKEMIKSLMDYDALTVKQEIDEIVRQCNKRVKEVLDKHKHTCFMSVGENHNQTETMIDKNYYDIVSNSNFI